MIKLILTPQTQPIVYSFEKNYLTIGNSFSKSLPDFALADASLHDIHVIIEHTGSEFIIMNTAEDPFTTINGMPFNKRKLHNGDLLQIDAISIQIEVLYQEERRCLPSLPIIAASASKKTPLETAFDLGGAMQQLEEFLSIASKNKPEPRPIELHEKQKIQNQLLDIDVEDLLQKVAELEAPVSNALQATLDQPLEKLPDEPLGETVKPFYRKSLKDELPTDEDPDTTNLESHATKSPFRCFLNWKTLTFGLSLFMILAAILCSSLYLTLNSYNEEEEILVAQEVADIAMALNFAQINSAQPPNQNWLDPDFLKHNLASILHPELSPIAKIDTQGHFLNLPYVLRIYTSNDANHFLIIAQPTPSMLQWLIPKMAITFDSELMELRKIPDLKILNRLLVTATLTNSNSQEIHDIVKQGELISLKTLSEYGPNLGFSTPKALAFLHPGAENLVYNAMRYYPLGESLMKKAIGLYNNDDNDHDLLPLIDEVSHFERFPNLVLYSSSSMQMARKGQLALSTFFPKNHFFFAYLHFNSQNIANSYLLIDEKNEDLVLSLNTEDSSLYRPLVENSDVDSAKQSQTGALRFERGSPSQIGKGAKENPFGKAVTSDNRNFQLKDGMSGHDPTDELLTLEESLSHHFPFSEEEMDLSLIDESFFEFEHEIDLKHPLYYKLIALYHAREHAMKLIEEDIQKEMQKDEESASQKIAHLEAQQASLDTEMRRKIIKAIISLQQEYATMPFRQFMNYIKAAHLEPSIEENLRNRQESHTLEAFATGSLIEEYLEAKIHKIYESHSLLDLDLSLKEASNLLTLDNFPDPAHFISLQNKIRQAVLNRIDAMLLRGELLHENELPNESRMSLSHILKNAWIVDEDETDYYFHEFSKSEDS